MGELYRVVEAFIEKFDELAVLVAGAMSNIEWLDQGEEHDREQDNKLRQANRALKAIHQDMKALADSLCTLARKNSALAERFGAISEICVDIYWAEIAATVRIGFPDAKKNRTIMDCMPKELLERGGGYYSVFRKREIAALQAILDDLNEYKHELKVAMAQAIAGSF